MAGVLFTDNNTVLAGYKDCNKSITGIGGKQNEGETVWGTAIREMIEELFELETIPQELFNKVYNDISSTNAILRKDYHIFILDFQDLAQVLKIVGSFNNVKSKVYNRIPTTIMELILSRIPNNTCEFTHLVLLPCKTEISIEKYFLNDIKFI